jgi:Pentapeptide repeats (8 copies)
VARLAERHGVRVRLRPRSPHGLTALVWLPDGITEREASLYGARVRKFAAQAGVHGRGASAGSAMPARPAPDARPANDRRGVIVPDHAGATGAHASTLPNLGSSNTGAANTGSSNTGAANTGSSNTGAANTGSSNTGPVPGVTTARSEWFRSRPSGAGATGAGTAAGNGDGSAAAGAAAPSAAPSAARPAGAQAGQQDGRGAGGNDGWAVGKHAAQIIAEPVRGDFTSAGLPTRVPRANLIPGSAGGRSAAGAPSRPGSGPDGQAPVTPRSPRSPDVARNRLSGFQRGVRRAKGLTPDDGEGADR